MSSIVIFFTPPREDEETSAYFKCLFPSFVLCFPFFCHKDGKNKGDLNFTEKTLTETILSLTIQIKNTTQNNPHPPLATLLFSSNKTRLIRTLFSLISFSDEQSDFGLCEVFQNRTESVFTLYYWQEQTLLNQECAAKCARPQSVEKN